MKTIIIVLIGIILVYECIEHVVFPLVWSLIRRKKKSPYGPERLMGKVGKVQEWRGKEGYVFVDGELWKAVCRVPLREGDQVIIRKARGLTLTVDLVHSKE